MKTTHSFFEGLSEDDRRVVDRLARPARFAAGTQLFAQGSAADCAYFLVAGDVDVAVQLPGGGASHVATIGEDGVLGELALVEDHHRSASAVARSDVEALTIARSDLQALCAQYHPASLQLQLRLALLVATRVQDAVARIGECSPEGERPSPAEAFSEEEEGLAFDVRSYASKLQFTHNFMAQDFDALLENSRHLTLSRGRWLWREGSAPDSCFLIVRGAVRIEREHGDERRVAVLGPGQLVGASSLLLERPRLTSCRAAERASLLEIPRSSWAALMDPSLHVAFRFAESLVRGLMLRLTLSGRSAARMEHHRLANVRRWQGRI